MTCGGIIASRCCTASRGRRVLELAGQCRGDLAVDRGVRAVRIAVDHGGAGVGRGPDVHVQRDLAEERHAEALRLVARAAMAKDVRTGAAMRALEVAHV